MIAANEIRLGNWLDCRGIPVQVDPTIMQEIVKKEVGWIFYNPIELTPEVLEGSGFFAFRTNKEMTLELENDGERESLYLTCYDKSADTLRIYIETSQRGDDNESKFTSQLTPVGYLHQLQNLYFSLTGQELEIKIPESLIPFAQCTMVGYYPAILYNIYDNKDGSYTCSPVGKWPKHFEDIPQEFTIRKGKLLTGNPHPGMVEQAGKAIEESG